MRILYICYSCDPFNGSEDQIGWNTPISSFFACNEVYVLTKKEHQGNIENYLKEHTEIKVGFYFVDIPHIYKRVFKGILYSARIIKWQKRAFKIAKQVCKEKGVSIIHQVAPVEYRALGDYGRIPNITYIAGPIGGGFKVPKPMRPYLKKHFFQETIRKIANFCSLILLKASKKVSRCHYLYFCNEETFGVFKKYNLIPKQLKYSFCCDIGIKKNQIVSYENHRNDRIIFLVPGRLYYRKGHRLLFDSLPREFDNYEIRLVGFGPDEKALKRYVENDAFLRKVVIFVGKVDYTEMKKEYLNSNFVILPSLSEATGTVLIEALSFSRPIITGDYFGAHYLKEFDCGWFYSGNSTSELVESFRQCLIDSLKCSNTIFSEKVSNAKKCAMFYSWEEKVKNYLLVYQETEEMK